MNNAVALQVEYAAPIVAEVIPGKEAYDNEV